MALIAFLLRKPSTGPDAQSDPDYEDLSWGQLWAIEMRDRRWLWIANLVLLCWGIGQLASVVL